MASQDAQERLAVVFQGGVAHIPDKGFVVELNASKSVSLGAVSDLWDAVELFIAGLRHLQSMLRPSAGTPMHAVAESLQAAVASGKLGRDVALNLAAQAQAHQNSSPLSGMAMNPVGQRWRTGSVTLPAAAAAQSRSLSLAGHTTRTATSASNAAVAMGVGYGPHSNQLASKPDQAWQPHPGDTVPLPALDGMQSDASDAGPALQDLHDQDTEGGSAAATLAAMASTGRKRSTDMSVSDTAQLPASGLLLPVRPGSVSLRPGSANSAGYRPLSSRGHSIIAGGEVSSRLHTPALPHGMLSGRGDSATNPYLSQGRFTPLSGLPSAMHNTSSSSSSSSSSSAAAAASALNGVGGSASNVGLSLSRAGSAASGIIPLSVTGLASTSTAIAGMMHPVRSNSQVMHAWVPEVMSVPSHAIVPSGEIDSGDAYGSSGSEGGGDRRSKRSRGKDSAMGDSSTVLPLSTNHSTDAMLIGGGSSVEAYSRGGGSYMPTTTAAQMMTSGSVATGIVPSGRGRSRHSRSNSGASVGSLQATRADATDTGTASNGRGRARGNFVASLAQQAEIKVTVHMSDKSGKPEVRFSMPIEYLDIRSYDEKTSGRLPLETIMELKQWVAEHWEDPYPSETAKEGIAIGLGLTKQQVSNWFRNERKRLWLPLKRRAEEYAKVHAIQPTPLIQASSALASLPPPV